jgi:hypothetical protein
MPVARGDGNSMEVARQVVGVFNLLHTSHNLSSKALRCVLEYAVQEGDKKALFEVRRCGVDQMGSLSVLLCSLLTTSE